MAKTIREVVAVFDDTKSLDAAVYALQARGLDRAAFSLLASEAAVAEKVGHRYRQVKDVEDDPDVPRSTFFSRVSRLETDYLPAPILASVGALVLFGVGTFLPVLVAAGTGGLIGVALSRVLHEQHAARVQEQLTHGGLLLWVNVRNTTEEETAMEVLRGHTRRMMFTHTTLPYSGNPRLPSGGYGRVAALSSSSVPCAAIVPVVVGGPFSIHSNATAISAPTSGPIR